MWIPGLLFEDTEDTEKPSQTPENMGYFREYHKASERKTRESNCDITLVPCRCGFSSEPLHAFQSRLSGAPLLASFARSGRWRGGPALFSENKPRTENRQLTTAFLKFPATPAVNQEWPGAPGSRGGFRHEAQFPPENKPRTENRQLTTAFQTERTLVSCDQRGKVTGLAAGAGFPIWNRLSQFGHFFLAPTPPLR
jgi:hypothetical protein